MEVYLDPDLIAIVILLLYSPLGIYSLFKSKEPKLLIVHDDDIITQTILCAEDDDLVDVPTAGIIDGLIHVTPGSNR